MAWRGSKPVVVEQDLGMAKEPGLSRSPARVQTWWRHPPGGTRPCAWAQRRSCPLHCPNPISLAVPEQLEAGHAQAHALRCASPVGVQWWAGHCRGNLFRRGLRRSPVWAGEGAQGVVARLIARHAPRRWPLAWDPIFPQLCPPWRAWKQWSRARRPPRRSCRCWRCPSSRQCRRRRACMASSTRNSVDTGAIRQI